MGYRKLTKEAITEVDSSKLNGQDIMFIETALNLWDRKDIANTLGINQDTIKYRFKRIYKRMGLKDIAHFYFHFMPRTEVWEVVSNSVQNQQKITG